MKYLSIKSFEDLQHYKDWQPPWIKLYNRLLDDYAFPQLSETAQIHLVKLWLLASRHDNRIPNDLVYITRAIQAKGAVDLDEMIVAGFVVPTDSAPRHKRRKRPKLRAKTASRRNLETVKRKSDVETETEGETDKRKKQPSPTGGNWVSEGSEVWSELVAPIEPGRFGRALKVMVQKYGWPDTRLALLFYIEDTEGRPRRVEWFVADAVRCVRLGKMGLVDSTGGLTERGELARRQVARLA